MSKPTSREACLSQEALLLKSFVALLKGEQSALIRGLTDELSRFADEKNRLADELTCLRNERLNLGSDAFTGAESTLRDSIRALAAEAGRINQQNGRLIGERMSKNQAALQILFESPAQPTTYGPDGQTQHGGGRRPLGSA